MDWEGEGSGAAGSGRLGHVVNEELGGVGTPANTDRVTDRQVQFAAGSVLVMCDDALAAREQEARLGYGTEVGDCLDRGVQYRFDAFRLAAQQQVLGPNGKNAWPVGAGAWQFDATIGSETAFDRRSRQHVGVAQKVGDKARRGFLVKMLRRAFLHDPAGAHDNQPIGHHQGLLLVVGDEDRCETKLLLKGTQLHSNAHTQLGVEVRQGFIEQEDVRVDHKGAGYGHTLLLAAR